MPKSKPKSTAKPKAAAKSKPKPKRPVYPKSETKRSARPDEVPSELIDARVAAYPDWRGATLARARELIRAADPAIVEEWKWGVPVWSAGGIVCTGEVYKAAVKLTFAKGAAVPDPAKLFNASLDGNVRRAIDLREGDTLDPATFTALVRAAIAVVRR